jgi:hypothetical protein
MPPDSQSYHNALNGFFSQFYRPMAILLASNSVRSRSISKLLIIEAQSRLPQLDYPRAQIMDSEDTVDSMKAPLSPEMAMAFREAMFKCQLYAEAFYLFAFRVVDITRQVNRELFAKTKICSEPQGVCDVRNRLIVHSEKEPVLNRSFDVSIADGRSVVLKWRRLAGEEPHPVDPGFRTNAAEFQSFLETWTREAANRLSEPPAL